MSSNERFAQRYLEATRQDPAVRNPGLRPYLVVYENVHFVGDQQSQMTAMLESEGYLDTDPFGYNGMAIRIDAHDTKAALRDLV